MGCEQLNSFEPQNLSPNQVEELHDDIERYLSLEDSDINIDFWTVRRFSLCSLLRLTPFPPEHDGCLQGPSRQKQR